MSTLDILGMALLTNVLHESERKQAQAAVVVFDGMREAAARLSIDLHISTRHVELAELDGTKLSADRHAEFERAVQAFVDERAVQEKAQLAAIEAQRQAEIARKQAEWDAQAAPYRAARIARKLKNLKGGVP